MQGDAAGGQVAPVHVHARDLQPSGRPGRVGLDPTVLALDAPVPAEVFLAEESRLDHESLCLRENIDRRMADAHLVRLLADKGFEGTEYDRFVTELVRYGVAVLRAWMHSGYVFKLVAERGFGLKPNEFELEELHRDGELRDQLATMIVAKALPRFRRRALVEGGWRFEGGASITTYFMGACVYDFPNEFRSWRANEERQARALRRQKAVYREPVSALSVADEVLGNLEVIAGLEQIKNKQTRDAVVLTLEGYSQEEIRELLGASSARAIEGLIYRWRVEEKKKREGRDRRD
ncbi:hypothetical protein ACFWOG_12310 [Kitasatospora sp. NPDC058406]|uniref:hypothetical protein n=1 Tax=Kitasatospora sp. NPDC058406 TaxID=3346483 RepID=UPI0036550ABF